MGEDLCNKKTIINDIIQKIENNQINIKNAVNNTTQNRQVLQRLAKIVDYKNNVNNKTSFLLLFKNILSKCTINNASTSVQVNLNKNIEKEIENLKRELNKLRNNSNIP